MRAVILPQALRNMLPSLVAQFVTTLKETSLGYIIGLSEVSFIAGQINAQVLTQPVAVYTILGAHLLRAVLRAVAHRGRCWRSAQRARGAMIEFRNVTKFYGSFRALDDVTETMRAGEVVVVCGPSGSGKSTLIRTINRLEPIDSGQILLERERISIGPGSTWTDSGPASASCSSSSTCSRI